MNYEILTLNLFKIPENLERKYVTATRKVLEKAYSAIMSKQYVEALHLCEKAIELARQHSHPNHDDDFLIVEKVCESLYDYLD